MMAIRQAWYTLARRVRPTCPRCGARLDAAERRLWGYCLCCETIRDGADVLRRVGASEADLAQFAEQVRYQHALVDPKRGWYL